VPAPAPDTAFDRAIRGWRGYVLVALIALISSFGFGATSMPVMDGDEARFAQASRQMAESGDYIRIRMMDADRTKKPVGIYWLQAISAQAFEPITHRLNAIWPYRVPSALGVTLAAIATLWGGAVLVGRRAAFIGAALLAASILVGIEGMTAKTDAALLGFTTLAMAALAHLRAGSTRTRALALLFWAALACGALVKGPITAAVAGLALLTLALWERRIAWMRPLAWWPGPLLALALFAPWSLAINAETHGRFFIDMFAGDVAPKLSGHDRHGAPPGYFLLLLPFLIFPATYTLPAAARQIWTTLRAPRSDDAQAATRFLIAWALPAFLLFELLPSKLLHYTLPTYPALALLCGAALASTQPKRFAHPAGLTLFALAGAGLTALLVFAASFVPTTAAPATIAALAGGAIILAALTSLALTRSLALRLTTLIAAALALSFTLRAIILPNAHALNVSADAVAALTQARLPTTDARPLRIVGYSEASLVFMTSTATRFTTPAEEAAIARPGDTLIIEARALNATRAALAARGLVFAPIAVRSGRTTSDGSAVTLQIGAVQAQPSAPRAGDPLRPARPPP
jgi:4-amino-4-deoxy-L-arabinose transferase-like glycosyltransferase